jgi:hypothetical protein
MPAKRKTTAETQAALRRLFDARAEWERNERDTWPLVGMELTPGYTIHRHKWRTNRKRGVGGVEYFRNPEPRVWVLRRQMREEHTTLMEDTDPLVAALWNTLPEGERRRSRLFACCAECPVRFTKKGAIADTYRHGRVGRYDPPSPKELQAARLRAAAPPPELDPRDDFERMVAEVWPELTPLQRRTLYAVMRPSGPRARREWALEGASSPQAFESRVRAARRGLARALGRRFCPGEYDLPGPGRTGFDYARFFAEWNLL